MRELELRRLGNLPQIMQQDFPGGTVDKNLSADARGYRFDPWSGKIPHTDEQQNLFTTTSEPCAPQKEKLHNERLAHHNKG